MSTRHRLSRGLAALVLAVGSVLVPAVGAPPADAATPGVVAFGAAPNLGSPTGTTEPLVAMAASRTGKGYWATTSGGAVYAFGDAGFFGSLGGMPLQQPIVAIAPTVTGAGHWLIGADGGIFALGDAGFFGSTGAITLRSPVVGMAPTPSGKGYWLVAADGGLFAFGDAGFFGSAGMIELREPVVGMAATRTGRGYWLLGADGGLFAFGDARFLGSAAQFRLAEPVVGIVVSPSGNGYTMATSDGAIYTFGDAQFFGTATTTSDESVVSIAARPAGDGYWLLKDELSGEPVVAPPLPPGSGAGRRVVYSNSRQRVWLIDSRERVVGTYQVSGRRGVPAPGSYRVFSKSRVSTAHGGSLLLHYMTRFAHGRDLAIGFHAIPVTRSGTPIQTEAELGQYRSAGCVRQRMADAARMWEFAPVGTPVIVTP